MTLGGLRPRTDPPALLRGLTPRVDTDHPHQSLFGPASRVYWD